MWTRHFSKVYTGVNRKTVWRLWTDINGWPAWHGELEACTLEGNFEVGNHFMLKPKGMRAVKIMLTEIHDGVSFTDCTRFPGAAMYDTHSMVETPEGLLLSNKLVVTGPLRWLWIKLVAQGVADSIGTKTDALIALARGTHD
jgi:hypothetical protein